MKPIWRTLVSVGVIAAIGAGCGGGSGDGDAPGVTSPQAGAGSTLQKQKLLTTKFGEFQDSRLLSNSQGDFLLVWDSRIVAGPINSMFYHAATGWSQIKVVAPTTTVGQIIDVILDNQGNAVVTVGKKNILGVLSPDHSFVYLDSTNEWKPTVGENTTFGISIFLVPPTLVADNSETGVAYFVGISPAPENTTFYKKLVRVYRLRDASWETLEPAPMPTADELGHSCDIVCVDYVRASADSNGRLHVSFDVKDHGKRAAYRDVVTGWSGTFILDGSHQDGLPHETFLNIHPNGIGVAIWQHWTKPGTGTQFIAGRKVAYFNGVSWLPNESVPEGMSGIDAVHADFNGAIEVFGKTRPSSLDGVIKSERVAGMRRPSNSGSWSSPELLPDGAQTLVYASDLLEWQGGGWIHSYAHAYKAGAGHVASSGTPYRIEAWRYSADGWSELYVLADEANLRPLRFASFGNQLRAIEGSDFGGDVNTFAFTIP